MAGRNRQLIHIINQLSGRDIFQGDRIAKSKCAREELAMNVGFRTAHFLQG